MKCESCGGSSEFKELLGERKLYKCSTCGSATFLQEDKVEKLIRLLEEEWKIAMDQKQDKLVSGDVHMAEARFAGGRAGGIAFSISMIKKTFGLLEE